jgi:hypothetical protein
LNFNIKYIYEKIFKKNIIEQWNFENKLFNATLDNIKKINKFENEKEDNQKIKMILNQLLIQRIIEKYILILIKKNLF